MRSEHNNERNTNMSQNNQKEEMSPDKKTLLVASTKAFLSLVPMLRSNGLSVLEIGAVLLQCADVVYSTEYQDKEIRREAVMSQLDIFIKGGE